MRTSLIRRIGKLERAMMQDNDSKPADLSMLSIQVPGPPNAVRAA
jgi:hypothetical protein